MTSYPCDEHYRAGAKRSAEAIVPIALLYWPGRTATVADVGAGEGWFAAEFQRSGCDVLAIDLERPETAAPGVPFLEHDLTAPLNLVRAFDLAVCLEVAEHLPEHAAAQLVETLVRLSARVVFSAAAPGQGGIGHLNEQWPGYWAGLFAAHGYGCRDELRWRLWDDERVEPWYRQNILAFEAGLEDEAPPPAAVHPRILAAMLAEARRCP